MVRNGAAGVVEGVVDYMAEDTCAMVAVEVAFPCASAAAAWHMDWVAEDNRTHVWVPGIPCRASC